MTILDARDILLKISNLAATERKAIKTVVAMIDRKNTGKRGSYYSLDINDLNGEVWRDVISYDGRYQVSNLGRVKSFFDEEPKILKANKVTEGYLRLRLYKSGASQNCLIHRLVAAAFIPNP